MPFNGNEEQTHDKASRLRNVSILFVVAMWARVDRVAPGQEVLILSIIDNHEDVELMMMMMMHLIALMGKNLPDSIPLVMLRNGLLQM